MTFTNSYAKLTIIISYLFFQSFLLKAQNEIVGPNTVPINGTSTLSFTTEQTILINPSWRIPSSSATILNTTVSANKLTTTVTIQWLAVGPVSLSVRDGMTTLASKSITVIASCSGTSVPGTPVGTPNQQVCPGEPLSIALTPGNNGTVVQWFDPEHLFETVIYEGNTYTFGSQDTSPYIRFVRTINKSTYCVSPKVQVQLTIGTSPGPPQGIAIEPVYQQGSAKLAASPGAGGNAINWYSSQSSSTPLAQSNTYITPVINSSTTYYASTVNTNTGCESSTRIPVEALVIPLITPVKVKQEVVRKSGVTSISQLENLSPLEKTITIQYIDGLSRIQQKVIQQASPAGFDIIQPFEYDNKGRLAKSFLPYAAQTSNGSIHPSYATEQKSFYNNPSDKVADDNDPYSVNIFENSPRGRILNQGDFGSAWQPGANHTKRFRYTFNVANEVRKFDSEGSSNSFYEQNKILKTIVTDENGNDVVIFKDLNGRTLLKKEQLDEQINGVNVPYLETYYIYDDLDRIKYVISPKGVDVLQSSGWSLSASLLDQYVYQFVYDQRGRIVEKKVPGQAWMYYVYDKLNRLVLIQDGNLRNSNKWIFLKYDLKGRAILQGLYLNNVQSSRQAIQTLIDGLYTDSNPAYPAGAYFETRATSLEGYSNRSFPKANADNTALQVLNVNYFDNYDFDFNGTDDYSYAVQSLAYEQTPVSPLNYATGSKRLILGTNTWLYNYIFYDKFGRVIQERSNNQLNTAVNNITTSVYDFEGKLLQRKQVHNAGPGRETTVIAMPEYDQKGRLISIEQQTESGEIVTWINQTKVVGDGKLLRKLTNVLTAWNAGAFSQEMIPSNEDGWIEFSVGETTREKMAGLSDADESVTNTTIDYAFRFRIGGHLHIVQNGVDIGQFGSYTANDIFRIERRNDTIYYKKNSVLIYTSLVPSYTELHADCSFYGQGASIKFMNMKSMLKKRVARYEYNELGQIVDRKLHNISGEEFLQSIDYRYNIRGWLESINNASLNINTKNNDDLNDFFGMELIYNNVESGLNNAALFNGNISAAKWKGPGKDPGMVDQESYKYAYDRSGKLESAIFQMSNGSTWIKEVGVYNESIQYDHNGNIWRLQRNQRKHQLADTQASYIAEPIDDLTYTYNNAMGDQILAVEDASFNESGFKNGASEGIEYTYDINGNLLTDKNKGITEIIYNILGKPTSISFADSTRIEYTYDAAGNKISMKNYHGTTLLLTTHYVDGFVYENGTLSFFGSPEGRVVKNSVGKLEYQYAISDHQGNTRVVFSSETAAPDTAAANFESAANTQFQNYPTGANRSSLELFDHTDATTTATYSQLLNGGYNSQVGVSKSLKVYPGDKVKIEAYAKYWNLTSNSSNLTGFATALTSAFGVSAASTGEALRVYNGLNNFGAWVVAGTAHESNPGDPKGFVTILLFDKDHNFLDAAWDQLDDSYQQVGTSPKAAFDYLVKEVTVKQEGYAYIYLSNESATFVDIFFDDVTVTHSKTNIIQYNEYYPFGLAGEASWTREGNSNNFLYNGGSELNSVTKRYETFFRDYDPALGRFMQIDPYAVLYHGVSPYQFAQNNPITFNDPTGALVHKTLPCSCKDDIVGSDFRERQQAFSGGYHPSHWAEGIYYNDWELAKGSQTYADGLALGLTDIGGRLYYINDNDSYGEYQQVNGEWGYYVDSDGLIDNSSISFTYLNGELVRTLATLEEISTFVSVAQQGGPPDPPGNSSANDGFPLSAVAGGVMSSFGLGTDITLRQITKAGTQVKLAQKGAYIGAKSFSTKLGVAGLAVTGYDIYDQGLNTSRSLDVVMGGVAFIPGVGWAISGTYFVSNLITIGITGQSIGDHLQGAVTGQDGTKAWKPWGD